MAYPAFACRMYDVLYRPTEVILVLEFLDCNLRQLLRGAGPLSVVLTKSFTHQILQGLAYAKSKRCIHRDLKPANILVLPRQGIVKIADFGLSRSHDFAGGRYTRQVMSFPFSRCRISNVASSTAMHAYAHLRAVHRVSMCPSRRQADYAGAYR